MILTEDFLSSLRSANTARMEHMHSRLPTGFTMGEWCAALLGEVGETANAAKKIRRIDLGISNGEVEDRLAHYREEIADCFIYLDLICIKLDLPTGVLNPQAIYLASAEAEWVDLGDEALMTFWITAAYAVVKINRAIEEDNKVNLRVLVQIFMSLLCVGMREAGGDFEAEVRRKFNEVSDRIDVDIKL